ncbi:hypothetical protein EMCG_09149 [[Emmonsia] crescens]|uniref:Uncharacterized protein n=1 Tax=[Emmonsia] crescens TaxID=73230 RepID=A0A0G2I3K7_9EURO|nr:hypothetical protein EMCG_09149 [Emmonsia crescens UAMH 3008]
MRTWLTSFQQLVKLKGLRFSMSPTAAPEVLELLSSTPLKMQKPPSISSQVISMEVVLSA